MAKKIYQFSSITDLALDDNSLLWVVGNASTGHLFKPTIQQLKTLILGSLVNNSVILSDGSKLTNDAEFTYNSTTNALGLNNGSISVFATNTSSATLIVQPVNAGWIKTIEIDQPNTRIRIKNGNSDNGAIFSRPTHNDGETRFDSGATVDGSSNPLDGYYTFQFSSVEKIRFYKYGVLLPRLTTTERDAIVSTVEGLEIYNTTDHEKQVYNGTAWVSVGGGGTFALDYSFVTLTDAATITLTYSNKYNFKVTLGGNRLLSIPTPVVGRPIFLQVIQDPSGNRTIQFPANSVFPVGLATGSIPNTTTAGDGLDAFSIIYDGTNFNVFPAFTMTNV